MHFPQFITRLLPILLASTLGIAGFLQYFGLSSLAWGSFDWLIKDDHAQSLLGWLYFRTSDWALPLGQMTGYNYPIGSSIAFNDSFPWFSILLKLISPLLPDRTQITGLWMLLNFTLQGVFGFTLLRAFNVKVHLALLGTVFFVLSPILIFRFDIGHASLCAHWCILAALTLAVRYPRSNAPIGYWMAVLFFSWSTHPYIGAMVFPIAIVYAGRAIPSFMKRSFVMILASLLPVFLLGYFGPGSQQADGGFHFFTADILAFLNPQDRSNFFSGPRKAGSYEGFAWLGFGVWFLVGVVVKNHLKGRASIAEKFKDSPLKPLIIICGLMALFSLGSNVRLWGHWIIPLESLYAPFDFITGPLRSSGRFVWPLYYLVFAWIIQKVCALHQSKRFASLVLIFGLTLQIIDQYDVMNVTERWTKAPSLVQLSSPQWTNLGKHFRHMALVPPQYSWDACEIDKSNYPTTYYAPFALMAWDQKMTINSAPRARPPVAAETEYCKDFMSKLRRGELDDDTIYVLADVLVDEFKEWTGERAHCEVLDQKTICVSSVMGSFFASGEK